MFAGNFAPANWQFCNGQTLPINQYAALFALIGTFYGGNGTTTFQLPNLQGRLPIGQGQGPGLSTYDVGEQTGAENVTILTTNMPVHTHSISVISPRSGSPLEVPDPTEFLSATARNEAPVYAAAAPSVPMGAQSVGVAGQGLPVPISKPSLTVSFIIAMAGIFPSRN